MNKILILLFFFVNAQLVLAIETSIIYKIDNEIITNQDIKKEYKYLIILNETLTIMPKDKVFEIAKSSIIKEKIKKIEVKNKFKKIEIEKNIENKLFKNLYRSLDFQSEEKFLNYLHNNNLKKSDLIEKITIEYLWNQIILSKYSSMVTINTKELKEELLEKKSNKKVSFLLSEIIYEVKEKKNFEAKTKEIINNIAKFGFENTAIKYSISITANIGGKLDWVDAKLISKKIINEINQLNKGQITNPINLPIGFMILKINDIREEERDEFNIENALNKMIAFEKNRQLDEFSRIYFNKIKKNLQLNES
jgi:peptidyl-prolyl cis-trans isomerase SurA